MQAIMISDHAKWCALMMNGDKTLEVRTSKALAKATQKLIDKYGFAMFYVYCTKGKQGIFKERYNGYTLLNQNKWIQSEMNGKVIFKFRCYTILEIRPNVFALSGLSNANYFIFRGEHNINENVLTALSRLSSRELDNYLKGKKGYAWHISNLEIFGKPKELSEFKITKKYTRCGFIHDRTYYATEPLTKAPQSWQFIESEELL